MREEGIDNKQLIVAIQELEKEKGIKKDYLLDSIESALLTAYKRNYNSQENVKVVVDRETGASHLYSVKEVVEHVENPILQISLEEARKIDKEAQIGSTVDVELVPKNFGRIAAQTAKQVIIQKLREAEREIIYSEYSERKGEIVSGIIQKADQNIVVMDLGKVEGVMPAKEQKGVRIQNIINELNGEKIDVIEWNADLSIYISSALLPAQVMAVDIDEENRIAQVIVPDDQLSLAIGKSGQNARLAAKLTGLSDWRIDIKSETQFRNILMEKQAEMEATGEDNESEE